MMCALGLALASMRFADHLRSWLNVSRPVSGIGAASKHVCGNGSIRDRLCFRSGCFCPVVAMMKAAYPRLRLYLTCSVQASLDQPTGGRRLLQADMRPVFMIVGQKLASKPAEMAFVERDDMIKHLAANTTNASFGDSVLPGAPHTRSHRFDAARL